MRPPTLHVIYAGRGDAMILECDDRDNPDKRNFILVDGGPRNYISNFGSQLAPYHRYLASACQQILQGNEFACIVFSHPHEDHYGGYIHAYSEKRVLFSDTVFVPNVKSDTDTFNQAIDDVCTNAGLKQAVLPPRNEGERYLISPVKALFPDRQRILLYYGKEREVGKDPQPNDKLTENERSILMYTVTPDSTGKMGIFFTGDSNADIISWYMNKEFPSKENRRFAIYKIQHHGALADNSKDIGKADFSQQVEAIGLIYYLLKVRYGTAHMPFDEEMQQAANNAAAYLCNSIIPSGEAQKHYEHLGTIVREVHRILWTKMNMSPEKGQVFHVELDSASYAGYTWPVSAFGKLNSALNSQASVAGWDNFLKGHATTEYATFIHVRSVYDFYSSFSSDVYVVSANHRYYHPRSEVLVGLALAVRNQKRRARLYVTNGKSIDIAGLRKVVDVIGDGTVQQLFSGNHLRVSYLSHRSYMSLTGISQGQHSHEQWTKCDIDGVTEEITIGDKDSQIKHRAELNVWLEQTDTDKVLETKEYHLKYRQGDSWYYVYLDWNQGGFFWAVGEKDNPKPTWIDTKKATILKNGSFEVRCRAERFGFPSKVFRFEHEGTHNRFNFHYIVDIQNGNRLCHVTKGEIEFERLRPDSRLVLVNLAPAPSKLKTETKTGKGILHGSRYEETPLTPQVNSLSGALASSSEQSLRRAFELVNDPIKDKINPNIIETLSQLFQDKRALIAAVQRLPESLVNAGFGRFEVDLNLSTASIESHPLDGEIIGSAVLHRLNGEGKLDLVEIDMAGLAFQLNNIVVKVDKCHSPQACLTVVSEAILKHTGLKLNMAWKSSDKETTISFSSTSIAIKDLIDCLVSKDSEPESILKANIPLITKSSTSDLVPSMGNIPGPVHEVGFSLSQPFDLIDKYDLADIWLRTESSDWKEILPIPESSKEVESEILLRVLKPLHPQARRIAASVKLAIPVPSDSEKIISARFDAIPLTRVGDYDYRFRITSVGDGVTIPDIVDVVGLNSLSDKIKSIPVLNNVFNAVRVHEAGLSVERVQGKWEFREWDFDLYIPVFHLMAGSLSLADTLVKVESFGKEEIQVKGEATFRSEKLQKEAKVSLGLPTERELGYVVISSPSSLNLADIFSIFGLGDLPDVPFLSENSGIKLSYCDAKFEKPKEGSITILSSTANLRVQKLVVEPFKMQDIEFSLSWQRGGDNAKSVTSFELSALLLNIKSVITVNYDGGKNKMTASITPITGSPMKVVDVLSFLIRGVDSPLHSALRSLEVKIVETSLDLSTGSPSSFKLEMKDDATLQLPSATDTEPFTVGSITVEYSKVASKLDVFAALMIEGIQTNISLATSTNPTIEERSVEFGIMLQKGQKELGLMALLTAIGINYVEIQRPEGCPEFTIGTASIKGKFVDKDNSGLKFAQLSVHIDIGRVLMSDWNMSVDNLYVDVDYIKARSDKPFSASVSGRLRVAGSAEMTINYIDAKEILELQAKLLPTKLKKVKVKSILEWLSVDSIEDSLPSFISEAMIDMNTSNLEMSLSRHKGDGTSTVTVSLSFTLGSVTVQLARTRIREDGVEKEDKTPWKTVLRLAVNTLPRPPPLPLIGQMEQPFSTQIYWTNNDITITEVDKLNSLATFNHQKLLLSSRAADNSAFGQGLSFLLLNNDDIILASKPRKSKKRDGPSGKAMLLLEEESPESTEITKFDKKVNGVIITNVGLDYDAKGQKIKVKFTARMTIGPMDGELINFSMIIKLPQGERIHLSDWKKLDIDMGLDGLSLAMTGSNLNVAGTLHRIKVEGDNTSITGFEGGVSVKLKKYQFVGFGSYKSVKINQEEFVSLMAYAMLKGPMLKTGLVELTSISGGFGFGSKLEVPSITEIHKFPLLIDPAADPMVMFGRLRGTDGKKYMTERNGANWVAAGVSGTACELIDVKAVLTIPLDPSAGELAIVGTASAQFPRDAKPGKALAAIRIDFQGSIDMSRGSMLFEGRIADGSFILFDDCVLTGGFAVGAWFGTSPQAGDWCISIGGWHPAYQPPSHYPQNLPRMGLSWTYGQDKCLSLSGEAYAAVTPEALMGGLAVNVKYERWSCGAEFGFRTDLILYLHPLHYNARFNVHASLWYELDALVLRKKFTKSLSADLTISGPPFGGVVEFKLTVINIRVKFGEHQSKPSKLSFEDFMKVVLKNAETHHVFALESGGLTLEKVPAEAQTPKSSWVVRGGSLAFSITSHVPTTSIEFEGAQEPARQHGGHIFARPMQLSWSSSGLTANVKVLIHKINTNGEDLSEGFSFEVIRDQLPASLWGSFDGNTDAMLRGASRESTVTHATGLRIEAPLSKLSTSNPQIILFSDLWKIKPVITYFDSDQARDMGFDAKPRSSEGDEEEDFARACAVLIGTDQQSEEEEGAVKARNTRRASIMSQWASIRKLKVPDSLRSNVPLRYAKGLASFSHIAPKVSVE
ncbi:hypothetical protein Focb16_v005289 [Fusarium oxysporum f. sp. cubense]|uniref:DUF6603 domain-containing protein n=1 Tax=Fusarium oxysporum f. sp. cubense TaxID=61366 RepID=A0A559LJJ6_FUSOC|nr:hypothetical protein Focb16_v005289 [Fusarium oxysporum f. sp. cubense]